MATIDKKAKKTPILKPEDKIVNILETLQNKFGDGIVQDAADDIKKIYSTGSLLLDKDIGIGGVPSGRIIEIYGPNASGKTTMALQIIADIQRQGGVAVYIDAENALDYNYAEKLGVDTKCMKRIQPTSGNQALDIVIELLKLKVDGIIIDSVAALAPTEEMDASQEGDSLGLHARMWSRYLRKINTLLASSDCCLILLNQTRQKINMGFSFGDGEATTGGTAIPFYASLRFRIKSISAIKQNNTTTIGQMTNIMIKKNRFSMPTRIENTCAIYNGVGFCKAHEILTVGIKNETEIRQQGNYYYFKDVKLGLGFENTRKEILSKPELMAEMLNHLKSKELL